jgi:hypothetical protein
MQVYDGRAAHGLTVVQFGETANTEAERSQRELFTRVARQAADDCLAE